MGTYTTNLNLYNTDMTTDGNDTFDFQRDINDNNDKIDSAVGDLSSLSTTEQSSLVGAINEVISNCGTLSSLSTTAKNNLVSAINELVGNLDGFASKSLGNLNSTGQAVIDKKVEVEALLASNGYAKFSWKKNNTTSKIIINWGQQSDINTSGKSLVFAQAFSTIYHIVINRSMSGTSQLNNYVLQVIDPSKTGFTAKFALANDTTTGHYIAIGY